MRLIHGGYDVSGVVEIVTTAINAGDLLVVISSSEETEQLIAFAKRVGAFVATIVLLTVKQDSTIGNLTDDIFKLAFLRFMSTGANGNSVLIVDSVLF